MEDIIESYLSKHSLIGDLCRIGKNCKEKRAILSENLEKDGKRKKLFLLYSGILSMLSAALMTSVVTQVVSSIMIQILAVTFAFLAGLIAIIATFLYRENDLKLMQMGIVSFIHLWEQVNSLVINFDSVTDLNDRINSLRTKYGELSAIYDTYLPAKYIKNSETTSYIFGSNFGGYVSSNLGYLTKSDYEEIKNIHDLVIKISEKQKPANQSNSACPFGRVA